MKNYVQPELTLVEVFSTKDVLLSSTVDLKENDYFDFGSNPWGGN